MTRTENDYENAREQYRFLRARGKLPSGWPETRALDVYFKVPVTSLADGFGNITERVCPTPVRWGTDERHCTRCNLTWGRDEDRPACAFKG